MIKDLRKFAGRFAGVCIYATDAIQLALRRTKKFGHEAGAPIAIMTAPFGSMGDQALVAGLEYLGLHGARQFDVLVPGADGPWRKLGFHSVHSIDPCINPLGFMTRHGSALFSNSDVTVIGADTLGGDYEHRFLAFRVSALNRSAAAGKQAQLVNASFSQNPTPAAIWLLRRLRPEVEIWARDALSQERLREQLQRPVSVAPDIGAFLEPSQQMKNTEDFVPRGVLVPNAHFATVFGLSRDDLIEYWVDLVQELQHYEISVLPHDTRSNPGDVEFAQEIVKLAESREIKVSLFVPKSAAEAKGHVQGAAFCVSGRMHAAVGALSTGVPTVGLDYLDKFQGQFAWYGDLGATIPFNRALDVSVTLAGIDRVLGASSGGSVELQHIRWF